MITLTSTLNISGTYTLTDDLYWPRNSGAAIVATGATTLNLNGHRIIGVGGKDNTAIGVAATNQSNITVLNGTVQGFSTGINIVDTVAQTIESYSQTNNRIVNMTLRDCLINGFILGGKDCTVDSTQIFNIGMEGLDLERAIGGQFFGPNATFSNSKVSLLYGGSESVGVSFSGRMQNGSSIVNSVLDGRVGSGQSFGVWSSDAVPFSIVNTSIQHWDYAFGGPSEVYYSGSIFANNGSNFNAVGDQTGHDVGGPPSTVTNHSIYPATNDVIIGDAAGRRYKAGPGNDLVIGMEGHDHLFGSEGADIFGYITPPSILDKDVIMDLLVVTNDRMGFAREIYGAAADASGNPRLQIVKVVGGAEATGSQATFLYYEPAYTLYYDPDGAGGVAKIPIAYLPYMIIDANELVFLDHPGDTHAIKRFALSWGSQAVGDFNNDGNADLLWRHSTGAVSEWLMRDNGSAAPFAEPAMPGANVIASVDLNGDGTTDLLWRDAAHKVSAWFMNEGHRVTGLQYGNFKGWELAAAGDFNGDGTADLLWQNSAGKMSEWLMFNGSCYASNNNLPNMLGAEATAGDFDGDGTTDVMWQNANGTNSVWLMDNGQRAATVALPKMQGWTTIAAGDFNGDGTDDLLWRHDTSGALIGWDVKNARQVGTDYFGQNAGQEFIGVGDVNNDGTDDLLWRHLASTDVKVWLL